jgi:hypothetical protein
MQMTSIRGFAITSACLVLFCAAAQAATPCAVPTTVGVVICAPGNGDSVSSPVEISAAGNGNAQLRTWKIYVDGSAIWTSSQYVDSIDPSIYMATGQHRVTVKTWDVNGSTYSQTINITVSSGCTATVDRTITICRFLFRNVINAGPQYSVSAVANDQKPISAMKLYINGQLRCTIGAATLAANGNVLQCGGAAWGLSGSTRVTVKAWDSLGSFSATRYFFVP